MKKFQIGTIKFQSLDLEWAVFWENESLVVDPVPEIDLPLNHFRALVSMINNHKDIIEIIPLSCFSKWIEEQNGFTIFSIAGRENVSADWEKFIEETNRNFSLNILSEDTVGNIKEKLAAVQWQKQLNSLGIKLGENAVKLDDGRILYNHHGKYRSNLTFLISEEEIKNGHLFKFDNEFLRETNYPWHSCGSPKVVFGKFFVSKKGAKCFEVTNDGPDACIRIDWGGALSRTRGIRMRVSTFNNVKYFRSASSTGGGMGSDYVVIPRDWRYKS